MLPAQQKKRGFTLLELLIVITILSILTLVIVLFINPVEILKKSRDVQRMSDLATLKTAVALHLQDRSTNSLGGSTYCGSGALSDTTLAATSAHITIADTTPATGATFTTGGTGCATSGGYNATTTADMFKNNGQGWIPYVNFSAFTGGAPIEKLPVDPINTATAGTCGVDSYYYRYGCTTSNTFEIDATLESDTYKLGGTDTKPNKDGGNSEMRFEVGTDLSILPSSAPVGFSAL